MCNWNRISRAVFSIILGLTMLGGDTLLGQARQSDNTRRIVVLDGREVVEGEVIVRYRERAGLIDRDRIEVAAHSDGAETIGRGGARRLRSRQLTTRQLLESLRGNPDVEYAEPNYVIRASSLPNDPSFDLLWGLRNTGQVVDGQAGAPGADIGADAAWDVTTGSRTNIVAILDTGIDFTHPDLAANLFTAPNAFSVSMGGNTINCAAGTHGYNALTNTCIPADDNGHGSHVAGIVGAVGNNGVGVTGVNWTANMMALKVLDADGNGTTADAIKAIEFAIKVKATLGAAGNVRVLNASWGGATFSQALNDQIQAANTADMLFVAAAGSDGHNNDVTPHYPASSTQPNVLSVAVVDNTGALADYSNYGATSVDLGAPGASTYSTLQNGGYGYLSGTSMAAPFVSGAAALVLSVCPSSVATLKSRLMSSVEPEASLASTTVSGGRLNIANAMGCVATLDATISGTTITATVSSGARDATDWMTLYCPASSADGAYIDWKYLNGSQTAPSAGIPGASVTFQAPSAPGTNCNVRLMARNQLVRLATSGTVTVGAAQSSISIGDVSVAEGNSGTSVATFTVTVSPVNSSQTVTVNYATGNGTATLANSDYAAASGTLTFPPSTATQTISVTVNGDTASEPNEAFVVNLSSAINATIADAQATGTITNDDAGAVPAVTVASTNVAPGGLIQFTVTNGPSNRQDWVVLSTATAPDGTYLDWNYLNGTKTAPASGLSSVTMQFTAPATPGAYNIRFYADNRMDKLATSATINVATQPSLSISDATVTEGSSGTVVATFTVTLAPVNSSQTVTVNYATANSTATLADNDYAAASGTLTFTPSTGTQTISVTVNGDAVNEPNETFVVNLSGATNAVIADAQGVGTISNDDGSSVQAVTVASTSVAPGGAIQFTVSGGPANRMDWVTLSAASAPDSNYLDWNYLNGTRTAPASGVSSASLQFTAPSTPGTYNIRFFADNKLTLLATSATITVGVSSQPTLTIGDVTLAEGNSGTPVMTFTVTLSPVNSSQTVTVNYATANGTASLADNDYAAASGTLTFSPSTATRTVSVTVNGDTTVEANETLLVNLSGATNAAIGDAQAVGTISNDDAAAGGPAVTMASTAVAPGALIDFTVSGGPANPMDWVTIGQASAPDNTYIDWNYLNGTKTAPATGQGSASLRFTAPSTPGTYNVRFFADNKLSRLATSATITVASQPTLTVGDVSLSEGSSGTSIMTFTVTLAPVSASQSVTVNYATADGTATVANNDYVAASGTLTFAPSAATRTISVTVNGDSVAESSETFLVNLSGAVNALIGDAQAIGTIVSDDSVQSGSAIAVVATTVQPGAPIQFSVSGGPANSMDWVTLTQASAPDSGYLDWSYINGLKTPPASGQSSATLQFTAPSTPGTYNIRFYADNRLSNKLATSVSITVAP